jgi:drug/metabolite transporter (DMT)-like permease
MPGIRNQEIRKVCKLNNYLGEISALLTSFFWAGSSVFFTLGGKVYGSLVVNRVRLLMALVFLMLTNWVLYGSPIPWDAGWNAWFWLGISGFVGLVLGDIFLFQAFLWLGPRVTMLIMSLHPVIGGLTAWLFLGEKLRGLEWVGILLALSGIAWVVWEGNAQNKTQQNPNYVRGILFALGAAAGQAIGLVLSKKGLVNDFPAISANVIRMVAAAASLWTITIFQGQVKYTFQQVRQHPRGNWFTLGGAIFGPFVGVSFSLYAVQYANVGVASTLMALAPILLLPISYFVFKERFGWGAIVGTLLAISGVALLFLV